MKEINYKGIKKILIIIFILNILVASTKLIIGYLLKASSVTADGFHAITDSASNIIAFIAIIIVASPPDKHHPYGHQKFEMIASFLVGIMLLLIGVEIVSSSIKCFINPVTPSINNLSLVIMIITVLVNIFVAIYEYKQGKKLDSNILVVDSIHTRSDVFLSVGVIVSLVLIKFGAPIIIDPIISLVIAVFIFKAGIDIFKSSTSTLVDKKVLEEDTLRNIILEEVENYEQDIVIYDIHKIRSRGLNNHVYIDLHLVVDPLTTIKEVHDLTHYIEDRLRKRLEVTLELNAHVEPNERC